MTTPVSPFSFFQGVDLSRTGQSVAPSLLPSVQAYENSGLARFGIGSGYRPQPYTPMNFMAPGLAALRVRPQEPVAPITDPIADSGGGGPGTGPGNGPGGGTPDGPGGESNSNGPTAGQVAGLLGNIASHNIPGIISSLVSISNSPEAQGFPSQAIAHGFNPAQDSQAASEGMAAASAAAAAAAASANDAAANIGIDASAANTPGMDAQADADASSQGSTPSADAAAAAAAAAAADGSDGSGNGDSASADGGGDYAMGGRPPVGKVSVVGEKGKELFVPDVPGTIIPHNIYMQLLKHTMSGRR